MENKQDIIASARVHETDTGSPEVQSDTQTFQRSGNIRVSHFFTDGSQTDNSQCPTDT